MPPQVDRLTGGCLCGSIRYNVLFSADCKWPPVSSACQCTMCRKWTASLICQFLVVPPQQIRPALETSQTYAEFESSPGRFRGFCSRCGSSLIWRSMADARTLDLFIGTLDENWLVSQKEGMEENEEIAKTIATPNGFQYWMENAIPGVTDTVEGGELYLTEKTDQ